MNRTLRRAVAAEDEREIAASNMRRWLGEATRALGPAVYNCDGTFGAGEWRFRCPIHGKDKPSSDGLIFSVKRGEPFQPHWWCRYCCGVMGMTPVAFMTSLATHLPKSVLPWEFAHLAGVKSSRASLITAPTVGIRRRPRRSPLPSDEQIDAWADGLRSIPGDNTPDRWLVRARLWSPELIAAHQIGWHYGHDAFVIPVRGVDDVLLNVRLWNPKSSERRWQNWPGHGRGHLWPVQKLAAAPSGSLVYLCAGEPDAMAAMSLGALAVTKTGGEAKPLDPEDLTLLKGHRVVVVYDSDATGRGGAAHALRALREYGDCRSVDGIDLWPDRDDGADLTDWIRAGNAMPMPLTRRKARAR